MVTKNTKERIFNQRKMNFDLEDKMSVSSRLSTNSILDHKDTALCIFFGVIDLFA